MKWAAILDGDIGGADLRDTKDAAIRDAAWIRSHPACRDRERYGNGGHIEVAQVVECEFTGELVICIPI